MARDTGGNINIDYVWGNMPMQPNDDRGTALTSTLGDHSRVTTSWNGYPGYVPNNSGTWDDITVPDVVGMTETAATAALVAVGLTKGAVTTANNAAGATSGNDGKVKTQTPAAAAVVNPSPGGVSLAVALVKYAYTP
jgi:hypothetical protein